MRSRRLVDWRGLAISFLPTHIAIGVSLNTVRVPTPVRDARGQRIAPRAIRFVHVHIPMFYLTLSWQIAGK